VSIFISPNMPFDDEGNLVNQSPDAVATESNGGAVAPPGYGEHVLDQLFAGVDMSGFQTPAVQSGLNTPYYPYSHSRAGSVENLNGLAPGNAIAAAALSTRLHDVSLDSSQRNSSYNSLGSLSVPSRSGSRPQSTILTRSNSRDDRSGRSSPEHLEVPELSELNKVPSYATAVRTPARLRAFVSDGVVLPDYESATAPGTPTGSDTSDPLSTIREAPTNITLNRSESAHSAEPRPRSTRPRPVSISSFVLQRFDSSERRRLSWIQVRA
jgi:arrestin-related trafficking adapter 4/5/7